MRVSSVASLLRHTGNWGLRDYGTAKWDGGDSGCDHKKYHNDHSGSALGPNGSQTQASNGGGTGANKSYKDICGRCGAKRIDIQIGLEPTPEAYVETLRAVFREVWRILKDDGVCFINLGDSYFGSWGNYHPNSPPGKHGQRLKETARWNRPAYSSQEFLPPTAGTHPVLKPKDLVGIPWRTAFALQADGWWLRSDIIWAKPGPMPESVTDRCTRSHEYIFMLAKNERYFFDAEAIAERAISGHDSGNGFSGRQGGADHMAMTGGIGTEQPWRCEKAMRNKRDVWTVSTASFNGAHFAVFPPNLIKPCILAGTKAGDTVLDPFGGSGTTGMVAIENGRNAILIELNPAYEKMARQRCCVTPPLFA